MLSRNLYTLLLILFLKAVAIGQVYEGYKEVSPYKKRLAKVDEWLQTDPTRCKSELEYLTKEAKRTNNSTLLGVTYIYQGTAHYYVGFNDSARIYFDKAIDIANKISNNKLRSSASIRKTFVLDNNADPAILLRMMKDEYQDAKKRKDTSNMIYSLNGMAMFYERVDSTKQCIDSYMESIKIAQQSNNLFEYGFLLNNRGLLKLRLKSPEDAYADLQEGLKIAKKLESSRLEITIRENLGYYFMDVDSLERAEEEYLYALDLSKRKNYSLLWFNSMVNLGSLERSKGNIEKSDSLMWVALDLAKKNELNYATSKIYLTLAQLNLQKKKFNEVDELLDSAYVYKKYGAPNEIQEGIYLIRYRKLEGQQKYKEALEAYRTLRSFRDSVDNQGHLQLMNEMQLKYDVEKSEKEKIEERREYEKKLAQEKLDNANLRQNIGIVSTVFILILALVVVHYYRTKQRKEIEFSNALVNKLEDERNRIARDLHDGLGQSLVILKNKFTRLISSEPKVKDEIDDDFSQVIEEVRSISRSLVPPELRRLGLKPALEKLLDQVEVNTGIMVLYEIDPVSEENLSPLDQVRVYRVVQELINNTIKHAQATSLKVELYLKNEKIEIIYQDNGIGFDIEKAISKDNSLGMKSIEQRVRALNGTYKFEKVDKGIKFKCKFKPL